MYKRQELLRSDNSWGGTFTVDDPKPVPIDRQRRYIVVTATEQTGIGKVGQRAHIDRTQQDWGITQPVL
ncbi:MAG TPA: hypothetical protein DCQ04_00415 [Actinobacteria bacterium]|nr:hypothetical protein [Actinomycetota bacterium]